MSKTFLMMAGGTGGHIFPALAVAQTLLAQGHHVVWLGSENAMETRLVPSYNIPLETLAIKGVRGNGLWRKLQLPFVLVKTIHAALKVIRRHRIDGVIGFGGFASFPGGVAARMARIPLIIHEQNAVAGLSNRALAKIATRVLYAFPEALPYPHGLVGNPVRAEIAALPPPAERFAPRTGTLQLLVIGGSLGAKVFNDTLPEMISALPIHQRPQIRHQCGRGNSTAVAAHYQTLGITAECSDFIDDMVAAYRDADFVICRAGALTVAELAAAGLGGFLIPFPHAVDDHQTRNAHYLVAGEAALCVTQPYFIIDHMSATLTRLDRTQCLAWASNARALALPDAAQKMAEIALKCVA